MNFQSEKMVLASRNRPGRKKGKGDNLGASASASNENLRDNLINFARRSSGSGIMTSLALSTRSQPRFPQQISPDWITPAIARFFTDFVVPVDEDFPIAGFLDFLPEMYSSQPQGSVVPEAVKAVALAKLANRSSMEWVQVQAKLSYGNTLRLLRAAMQNPIEARSDEVMAALMIVRLCEVSHPRTISHTSG